MQLDVKEEKKIESHPQWDISDEEDEEKEDGDGSESDISSFDESDEDWANVMWTILYIQTLILITPIYNMWCEI